MRAYMDWEFVDTGRLVIPISVGMVTEDGHELYCVFDDIDRMPTRGLICAHPFLVEHVVPKLPLNPQFNVLAANPRGANPGGNFVLDDTDNTVMPRRMIRNSVRAFLDRAAQSGGISLWAYIAAYDFLCLAQLFGPLVDRPKSMPMRCNDLAQLMDDRGVYKHQLPPAPEDAHHALADAKWVRAAHEHILEEYR